MAGERSLPGQKETFIDQSDATALWPTAVNAYRQESTRHKVVLDG
jgi:hypothetical protein